MTPFTPMASIKTLCPDNLCRGPGAGQAADGRAPSSAHTPPRAPHLWYLTWLSPSHLSSGMTSGTTRFTPEAGSPAGEGALGAGLGAWAAFTHGQGVPRQCPGQVLRVGLRRQ